MADNFAARFAQGKLATKDDIVDFGKVTEFDDRLKELNEKVNLLLKMN